MTNVESVHLLRVKFLTHVPYILPQVQRELEDTKYKVWCWHFDHQHFKIQVALVH